MSTDIAQQRRQALVDRAVELQQERADNRLSVEKALRLFPGERLGDLVELADGVVVAEILNAAGDYEAPLWQIVLDGTAMPMRYLDRWTAVLAAVGLRFNAGPHASRYAARVLNVPQQEES
jgi:hypothetical protein